MNRSNDSQLVSRLQARDEAAVQELAEKFGPRIHQLALRHVRNPEDAEEVTQDVLMKVYRKIDAFRGDSALSSWIYRITFNTAMSRLRSGRVAKAAELDQSLDATTEHGARQFPEPADWSRLPDEDLLRSQLREAAFSAIQELPEIYRIPIVLRDIQGLTTEEASTRLHVKDQTLKSRLHRGRVMLRERLREFAGGLNLHRPTPAYS
jgi:RNA polymerase sigma-70 factor (ECF subfamily)